jgi:branched-chain amino acid aminotransferase
MLPEFIAYNGSFVPYQSATAHVMSPVIKYGLSVFEGVRAYWSEADRELYVFRLAEHTERLFQSMKLLRFEPGFSRDDVNGATLELLRRNKVKSTAHIRTIAYLDGAGEMDVRAPVSYAISALERTRSAKVSAGIRVQVSAWIRLADNSMPPRVKCGANYVNSRMARLQAKQDGYDEAILMNSAGKVAEATAACLFLVRNGVLVTPDVTSGILEGVTRDTLIELARDLGIQVVERTVDKTELYAAKEVFVAGSAAEVLPVVAVDGIAVDTGQPGPITAALQKAYFAAVTGAAAGKGKWLTAVHAPR